MTSHLGVLYGGTSESGDRTAHGSESMKLSVPKFGRPKGETQRPVQRS